MWAPHCGVFGVSDIFFERIREKRENSTSGIKSLNCILQRDKHTFLLHKKHKNRSPYLENKQFEIEAIKSYITLSQGVYCKREWGLTVTASLTVMGVSLTHSLHFVNLDQLGADRKFSIFSKKKNYF